MEEKDPESNIIFCGMCSVKVRKEIRYCWNCNADQTTTGPPSTSLQDVRADPSISLQDERADPSTSFGRPQSQSSAGGKRKAMSFDTYLKAKSSERQSGSDFRSKKKPKVKDKDKEVVVNIGIKELCDLGLKTIRGKRLPLCVTQSTTYAVILQKAVQKWSAFDKKFDASKEYVLLYDDETCAQFMPGGHKEFFTLNKYKIEVGKDYKRLVFYLCKEEEYRLCEEQEKSLSEDKIDMDDFFADDLPDEIFVVDDSPNAEDQYEEHLTQNEDQRTVMQPPSTPPSSTLPSSTLPSSTLPSSTLPSSTLPSSTLPSPTLPTSTQPPPQNMRPDTMPDLQGHIHDYKDVVKALRSKVNHEEQFFITTRRKAPFSRILNLWKRQALKCDPTYLLRVHYSGEDGIDSGALSLEFLEECISEMGKTMFSDGSPVDSSSHVQSGNFRACGQIVAVSLAQGGPPPCFLEKCSYEAGFTDVDMMNIVEEHLTTKETKLLDDVKSDCVKHTDLILDHGYTGLISNEHVEAIVRSLKVSFVSRRRLYMREFMIGLGSYGLDETMKRHPSLCQPLFVNGDLKKVLVPTADYIFSLLVPQYSKEGTSRRHIEEELMDHLQDTLMAFEDENVTGHKVALAWDYKDGDTEVASEIASEEVSEKFETPCVNIPGVMGWLTGMQHRPVSGEEPKIIVSFDHDCLERNPKHSICFPLVSACGRTLTIPVMHMRDVEKFKEIFLLAYCKGNSFGKP